MKSSVLFFKSLKGREISFHLLCVKTLSCVGHESSGILLHVLSVQLTRSRFQDGRLQVDDQIIEVNGESLIGKSNTAAMGILRGAMQRNCITKHYISVVVRRERQPPGGRSSSYVDLQPTSPEEQRISMSDAPPFLQAGAKRTTNKQDSGSPMVASMRTTSKSGGQNQIFANPLLGHLSDGNGLRNTSYQMATHDSLNEDDSDDQRKAVLNELDSAIEMVLIINIILLIYILVHVQIGYSTNLVVFLLF